MHHRLFIHRLCIEQRLGEGIEGRPAPPEDRGGPVECRFQPAMNACREFSITIESRARITIPL
jgi:hypothetical protein